MPAVGSPNLRQFGRSGGPSCSTCTNLHAPCRGGSSPAPGPRTLIPSPVGPTRAIPPRRPDPLSAGSLRRPTDPPVVIHPEGSAQYLPAAGWGRAAIKSRAAWPNVVRTTFPITCEPVVQPLSKFRASRASNFDVERSCDGTAANPRRMVGNHRASGGCHPRLVRLF